MTLMADESVDGQIVDRLRSDGYTVLYVAEMNPGIRDEEILENGLHAAALLVTSDKGFGEPVFGQRRLTAGVVLFRLAGYPPEEKAEIVSRAFRDHGDTMVGAFSVVMASNVRIRRVPQ